jgi:hypothetical protein
MRKLLRKRCLQSRQSVRVQQYNWLGDFRIKTHSQASSTAPSTFSGPAEDVRAQAELTSGWHERELLSSAGVYLATGTSEYEHVWTGSCSMSSGAAKSPGVRAHGASPTSQQGLVRFTGLRSLSLQWPNVCSDLCGVSAGMDGSLLSQLPELRALHVAGCVRSQSEMLYRCVAARDRASAVLRLTKLTSLLLPFTGVQIEDHMWLGPTGAYWRLVRDRSGLMAQSLQAAHSLAALDLSGCLAVLGGEVWDVLAPALAQLTRLTKMALARSELRDAAAPLLAQATSALPALRHVDLSGNRFSDGVFRLLRESLQCRSEHVTV